MHAARACRLVRRCRSALRIAASAAPKTAMLAAAAPVVTSQYTP